MDHDDDDRDLDLDHHAEWCKDNPIERALEETVQTGKNTTELAAELDLCMHRDAAKALRTLSAEVDRLRYAHAEAMSLVSTASAELTRLRAVAEAARAALLEIARPGVGPELHDTAEERADYWAHACEVERQTARGALAALAALEGT